MPYVRKSYFKHYNEVADIVPFCKRKKLEIEKDKIDDISIEDKIYYGKHWFSFIRKYLARKALKLTKKELEQAVEGMYHNLNTLQSRSGNQLPFTSINFGTCTSVEGRMVIKALLEGNIKGVGKVHRTPIFPCSIFQYMKGVNDKPGTPNYDLFRLALKSTAKRLYPNYVNCLWSNDQAGNLNDRKIKQAYLDSLSKAEMTNLIEWCENNPALAKAFGFEVVDE